ncbi:hypothetical protein C8Q76DRAFT_800376 [Earliella scabrosa]|nr:hypothetical protein C8Q76DRAFT_800376 [Earliella scabrosa]
MQLLDLNDDVLYSIFSHLHGQYALSAALTCRRIYGASIHRVVSVVKCQSSEELCRIHNYLCSGTHHRANHVQELCIYPSTFIPLKSSQEGNDFRTHLHGDFDQAYLVGDILGQAPQIHRLVLPRFHPLSERDSRLIAAVRSLRNLETLKLDTIGDSSVRALHGASFVDLRSLFLSYHNESIGFGLPIRGETITFAPLLELLSFLPRLHSLTLQFFTVERSFHEPMHTPPSLPSVKHLHLYDISPTALDIVQLCPNVSTTYIALGENYHHGQISPVSGQRWRTLRSLKLEGDREPVCIDNLIPLVHHLEFMDFVSVDDPFANLPGRVSYARLIDTFRKTSPVSASVWTLPGTAPMSVWSEIAQVAPRLRVLTLNIGPPSRDSSFAQWLDNLPQTLNSLRLILLSIWLPINVLRPPDGPYMTDEDRARERQFDEAMLRGGAVLPQGVADAIPTLRFIMLAGPRAITESDKMEAEMDEAGGRKGRIVTYDEDGDEEPDPDALEEELRWARRPGERTTIRTWRVVRARDERRLELLTNREAARMQEWVKNAGFDEIERVHGCG